jgi:PAS domain S-box-containing protein
LPADEVMPMVCWYWILKLEARFLSGDYTEALAAADKVKPFLSLPTPQIQLLDYFYFAALTMAAYYENTSADEQARWRDLLKAHQQQLRDWAHNNPSTFSDKQALVSAEIARLEGRYSDAMALYEEAIRSAREHGFVKYEGLAHEVAAGFYAARSVEGVSQFHLRNARHCYLRWGALGKVRQLERLNPWLAEESTASVLSATINAPVEQLDVGTVVKASQAVSSEIALGKLIETLMKISVEHAGAERGLLILFTGDEPRIAAEARTGDGKIEVTLRDSAVTPSELIEPVLHTALRTRESVLLDDASARIPFSADEYVRQNHARSVLCLPLVKQGKLVGALYLENNLTARVFTSAKLAVLTLLASQAAISLENVRLYDERKKAEQKFKDLLEAAPDAMVIVDRKGEIVLVNSQAEKLFGYQREELLGKPVEMLVPEHYRAKQSGQRQSFFVDSGARSVRAGLELHGLRRNGTEIPVEISLSPLETEEGTLVMSAIRDITERKHAQLERELLEQRLRQAEKMESVGRLAAGIAHDFNNVLAGVFAYGEMLFEETPERSPLRRYAQNVLTAATRGRALVDQILDYSRSQRGKRAPIDIGPVVAETLELLHGSLPAAIRLEASAPQLPLVVIGDATQLHQVVMNLCSNAIQAMSAGGTLRVALETTELPAERALSHGTLRPGYYVRLTVEDSGSGMDSATLARIFEPFFTTKEIGRGTGLGLSLVYAIVTDAGGAMDVLSIPERGSTFTIYLPSAQDAPVVEEVPIPLSRAALARVLHREKDS